MCRSLNDSCGGRRCVTTNPSRPAVRLAAETLQHVMQQETSRPAAPTVPPPEAAAHLQALQELPLSEAVQAWRDSASNYEDTIMEQGLMIVGQKVDDEVETLIAVQEENLYMQLDEELEAVYGKDERINILKHQLLTASAPEREALEQELALLQGMGTEEEELERCEARLQDDLLEARKGATLTVLSSIRSLGADMEGVQLNSDTAGLSESLAETVFAHYPTEWLTHHAAADPVHIESSVGESFYAPAVPHPDGPQMLVQKIHKTMHLTDGEGETPHLRELFEDRIVAQYGGVSGKLDESRHFYVFEVNDELYDPVIHGEAPDPADGWELRETYLSFAAAPITSEEQFSAATLQKSWVRRSSAMVPHRKELHMDASLKDGQRDAVLYHEFGHRFEDTLPDSILPRMERAFLLRRSGKDADTEHHRMLRDVLQQGIYHDGKFVNPYVGRDYFTGSSYEVFSTGVEAVYGKAYGGLTGAGDHKSDADHRQFTLGALAAL